jgi:dihydrodipicolinate synthase/N-acetylneuraminate lyase
MRAALGWAAPGWRPSQRASILGPMTGSPLSFGDPAALVRPRRRIRGMSAILLPFRQDGAIDWDAFAAHVVRTAAAGITPAVNMDTGYVQLIDDPTRRHALAVAREALGAGGELVAGACVVDAPGAAFDEAAYGAQFDMIAAVHAIPVIFPSWGLTTGTDADFLDRYRRLAARVERFIGFELGTAFVPNGRVLALDAYGELMQIPNCLGAKHSSLSRRLEWARLAIRDQVRPEFHVFTGNDLAIDMVRYGSDWLLGLSTGAPEAFAQRDRWWAEGDDRFDELDDALQALGDFAFREPVPAYKHSMAQVLFLRGMLATDEPHPDAPRRPASDREIIATILARIEHAVASPPHPARRAIRPRMPRTTTRSSESPV